MNIAVWAVGMGFLGATIAITSLVPQAVRESMRVDFSFLAGMFIGVAITLMLISLVMGEKKTDEEVEL